MLTRAEAALAQPLPIGAVLPRLRAQLTAAGAAVLVSPPGTGKTTLVPLALADLLADLHADLPGVLPGDRRAGRVLVAEPRRIAARAAASRMAELLGQRVGDRVGYTVRGDRRVGRSTVVEVVTTGVLVQRLQRDQELPGVGAVVLDECHERHLDTDLALAFLVDVRATLRPDLLLLATSATADADRLAAVLGTGAGAGGEGAPAPVIGADAPLFEVTPLWCPPSQQLDPPRGMRVDPRLLDHVAATVRRALTETSGDLLVFLPGAGEIAGVAARLGRIDRVAVQALHGRLGGREQDETLRPASAAGRRVVLATAIAESSLTVPGVRAVVDAGLARVPRTDLARGLGGLATVRVSRAAAHQRAGRAGREAPGQAYRCWSQAEHGRLPAHPEPEVEVADLTGFMLELARWGDPEGTATPLLQAPPAAAAAVARQTLQALGALDGEGRVTGRGRRIAAAGVHPRLARALLDGAPLVGARRAAELVAVLADDALAAGTDDLAHAWRRLRAGDDRASAARWREETRRLQDTDGGEQATSSAESRSVPDDLAAGIVAGLAHPERLARARRSAPGSYLMAIGTAAELGPGSRLAGGQGGSIASESGGAWLAVASAQRQAGAPAARVRLAAVIDEPTAREVGATLLQRAEEVGWSGGDVVARSVERLGAIVLSERPLPDPPRDLLDAALREGLRKEGLDLLTWSADAIALRARMAFCHRVFGADWPAVDDAALLERIDDWLGPELRRARRRADLAAAGAGPALRRLLDHRQAAGLDRYAPERLTVPTGSQVRLGYPQDGAPVLAVKLQEMFGCTSTPRVADGRVPVVVHLLSPAGRPVAVTGDLESFWRTGYPSARAELRGRYPRHPWPEDPLTAPPTRRAAPRTRR